MNKSSVGIFLLVVAFFGVIIYFMQKDTSSTPTDSFATSTPTSSPLDGAVQGQQGDQSAQKTAQTTPVPTTAFLSAAAATIKTPKGDIEVELYPEDAPKTVTNFVTHAKSGYYTNLTFHRVEPGFVIQGGDPNGNGTGGYSIYGDTFEDELNPSTESYKMGYKEGVLAMANRGPNTNGSQFFIMLADNESLPKSYTIFGKVTKGMDVVKQIVVGDKIETITPNN